MLIAAFVLVASAFALPAATSNANMVMFLLTAFVFGFGMASTILIGQAWGAREPDKARAVAGTTLTVDDIVLTGTLTAARTVFSSHTFLGNHVVVPAGTRKVTAIRFQALIAITA